MSNRAAIDVAEDEADIAEGLKPFGLGLLVHDVSRLGRVVVDKALKPMGVTRSQWWVLENLARQPGGTATQTGLASALDVSKVALGGLLDRLEEGGFITRGIDPADRRIRRVGLSRAGKVLLSTIHGQVEALDQQMLRGHSDEQIRMVAGVLQGLKSQLIQMNEKFRGESGPRPDEPGVS